MQRKKIAALQKQNYRLKKVINLELLIKNLKSEKFLSDSAAGVLSVSNLKQYCTIKSVI